MEHAFIAITPWTTVARNGNSWKDPIYGLNTTVWHPHWMQTNNLRKIELFEIELFDHLT